MSDPVRWHDDTNAPKGARDLLASAPGVPELTQAARARMAAQISHAAATGSAAVGSSWLAKALIGACALGVGSAGAYKLATRRTPQPALSVATHAPGRSPSALDPAPIPMPAHDSLVDQTPVIARDSAPTTATLSSAAISPPRGSRSQVASGGPSTIADEGAFMEVTRALAQRARTDGDVQAVLTRLREHERRFPRGLHAEEREPIALRALVSAGRTREARTRGEAFVRLHPNSIYASSVRVLLGTLH